jgi:hypothetical protein
MNDNTPLIIETPKLTLDQEIARVQALEPEFAEELAFLMGLKAVDPKQAIADFLTKFFFILENPDLYSVLVYAVNDQSVVAANAYTPAFDAFHTFDHEYLNYIDYV